MLIPEVFIFYCNAFDQLQIGCRKGGGLGAQKITTNFADIEKEAQQAGEMKEEANRSISPTPETESEQVLDLVTILRELNFHVKYFAKY